MTTRTKVIISIIVIAVAFASGRFLTPTKVKTEVKTVEVEKVVTKVVKQTITIHEKPDGTKDTVVVTDSKTDATTDTSIKDTNKEVTLSKSTLNVSMLVGSSIPPNGLLSYGGTVSTNLIGPIKIGGWFLTGKPMVGVSLGLDL